MDVENIPGAYDHDRAVPSPGPSTPRRTIRFSAQRSRSRLYLAPRPRDAKRTMALTQFAVAKVQVESTRSITVSGYLALGCV
jgi:hypothetical protein